MMTEHPDRGGSAERKHLVDLVLSVLSDPAAIEGWRHCGWPGVHAVRKKREEGARTLVDGQPHAQSLPRFAVVAHPDGSATVVPIAKLQLIVSERERFESSRPLLLPPAGKLFSKATFVDSPMEVSIMVADAQMQPPVEVYVAPQARPHSMCCHAFASHHKHACIVHSDAREHSSLGDFCAQVPASAAPLLLITMKVDRGENLGSACAPAREYREGATKLEATRD